LSDFSEILYEEAEWHVDKGYMTKTAIFFKSKMADGRHFENRKIAISVKSRPILMKFGILQQLVNQIAVL